jgi:hypothetical protein
MSLSDTTALGQSINGKSGEGREPVDFILSKEAPNVKEMAGVLQDSCNKLASFFDRCGLNYNVVRCKWEGQHDDQRKHTTENKAAYPFDKASDAKVPLIDDANRLIKKTFKTALKRMRVQAIPITASKEDVQNAHSASYFLKYLKQNIPNFDAFVEYTASQMIDIAGVAAAKVEYVNEKKLVKKKYSMFQLPEEVVMAIQDGNMDDKLVELLMAQSEFSKLKEKAVRKAIMELRETGETIVPNIIVEKGGIKVHPKSLCENLIFPPGVTDIQDSPYIFEVVEMPAEQLKSEAIINGWDKEWCDKVINEYIGIDSVSSYILGRNERNNDKVVSVNDRMTGLVQIVYCWERRVDKEDGSIGIYVTVFHPEYTEKFASFDLSDCEDGLYPFVVKKREHLSMALHNTRALTEVLEGYQFIYKECVDNAANRESISTFPPYEVMAGGGLDVSSRVDVGPGTPMVSQMGASFEWKNPITGGESINIEVRNAVQKAVDQYIGRPTEGIVPGEANNKVQDEIDTLAGFVTDVLKMAESKFRQYAPNEVAFKVIGKDDVMVWKNNPSSQYDYIITLDSAPLEDLQIKLEMFTNLASVDRTGKINNAKLIESGAQMIDGVLADQVITGDNTAYDKSIEEERNAITTIMSGQDIDLSPEEPYNQTKVEYLMSYLQGASGQQAMQNQITAPLFEKRVQQWQFKAQQGENAQIGRIGTKSGNAGYQ